MRKLLYSSTAHGIIPGMELITTHTHADFDSLAAMIAAKRLYPEAALVLPGPPGDKILGIVKADAVDGALRAGEITPGRAMRWFGRGLRGRRDGRD